MEANQTVFDRIASLGAHFKAYRKAIGLSQQDVHRKTGVAMSTISLFENGKGQGLSLAHCFLLLDALDLGVEPDTLVPEVHQVNLAKEWEKQNKRHKG